jgi:hypothetical protein
MSIPGAKLTMTSVPDGSVGVAYSAEVAKSAWGLATSARPRGDVALPKA